MSWQEVVAPPATAIAALVGWLGYQASKKKDALSAQSGVMSENREGINQKLEILNSVIDALQEERVDNRGQLKDLSKRLGEAMKDIVSFHDDIKECQRHLEAITKERDALKIEVDRLRSMYESST